MSRADQLATVKQSLLAHLGSDGADGGTIIDIVSLENDIEKGRVVAAMWQLVDDEIIDYAPGALLSLRKDRN